MLNGINGWVGRDVSVRCCSDWSGERSDEKGIDRDFSKLRAGPGATMLRRKTRSQQATAHLTHARLFLKLDMRNSDGQRRGKHAMLVL